MSDLYNELEQTWGKRAARGMRTCSRGRETLADGATGLQNLPTTENDDPQAAFMR
eukprot:CAMPEP_0119289686 /NCGR_PEP_ID=MMETSP1329-20130426/39458_1 /TAXON_ID=114041 /ORGANISM="Genus nov. species nov., Strain RCC1024" /LENGTH=54 /DNA_ID=CAMNT_0007290493 /DNA_START=171 /DNA_END=332 /DNA_ORIENTATION=-